MGPSLRGLYCQPIGRGATPACSASLSSDEEWTSGDADAVISFSEIGSTGELEDSSLSAIANGYRKDRRWGEEVQDEDESKEEREGGERTQEGAIKRD